MMYMYYLREVLSSLKRITFVSATIHIAGTLGQMTHNFRLLFHLFTAIFFFSLLHKLPFLHLYDSLYIYYDLFFNFVDQDMYKHRKI